MRRALYKDYLLQSVSFGAMGGMLRLGPTSPFELGAMPAAHGFLARVRLWLQLIFGRGEAITARRVTRVTAPPPNRHKARLRRRKLPLPRRPDALAHHFLRRYGYTRFRCWIYNRTLTSRIAWCFRDWNWLWEPRGHFARCEDMPQVEAQCGAPLCPD